jgi:hypothetical protein
MILASDGKRMAQGESRPVMQNLNMSDVTAVDLGSAQAAELAQLVELEARWENLRAPTTPAPDVKPTTLELQAKQKAYDAFRAKLAAYNKRYAPAHVPELLINTPVRLGLWCRSMRDLLRRVEHEPQGYCPVHLLEKAYRLADRVAAKTGAVPLHRSALPETIGAAVLELEALDRWCADMLRLPAVAG